MLRPWISVQHAFRHLHPSKTQYHHAPTSKRKLQLATYTTAQAQEITSFLSSGDNEGQPMSSTIVVHSLNYAARRSIRDADSWNWTSSQILHYLETWCHNPPLPKENVIQRQEMKGIFKELIGPSSAVGSPFVPIMDHTLPLNYMTVRMGHGTPIPITEFYTAMGWVISMVEPQLPGPTDYFKILATYAKWCHTIWRDMFPGTCVPTTASIKVVTSSTPDRSTKPLTSFWVSTSLPHAPLKEQARLIRERYMHDVFGQLPDAPIFVEAIKDGADWGRVKWGHCAETLTTMCSYLRGPVPDLMYGVAIKIKPVAKTLEYSPTVFSQATVEACDNCQAMMKHAKIAYRDWHNLSSAAKKDTAVL